MKRLLLLVLFLGILVIPARAFAADPFVPDRPAQSQAYGQTAPLYDDARYEPWAYTFEGDGQQNSVGLVSIYFWLNQMLVTKAWLLKVALRIVEYALVQNFFAALLTKGAAAMDALRNLLWSGSGPLVTAALVVAGVWGILLYLRGRVSRAWAALGGTLLVLIAATVITTAGTNAAGSLVGLSQEVSQSIYRAVDQATQGTSAFPLVGRAGDALWRSLVYQPWLDGALSVRGQADFRGTDGLDGGRFLEMSPRRRQLVCQDFTQGQLDCPWWQADFLPRRMLLAGWTFLAALLVSLALIGLAGGIILGQLTVLLLLMLAPVGLLIALWWPERGVMLLQRWLMRFAGALLAQAVLAAALAAYLVLGEAVNSTFAAAGWMFRTILLATLGGLIFRYRFAWLQPLSAVSRLEHWREARRTARQEAESGRTPAAAAQRFVGADFATLAPGTFAGPLGSLSLGPLEPVPAVGRTVTAHEIAQRERFIREMQLLRVQWADAGRSAEGEESGSVARTGDGKDLPALAAPQTAATADSRPTPGHRRERFDVTRIPYQPPRP